MYAKAGQAGVLIAHFVASGAAATGLTVTGKVWEIADNGTKNPNDTTGTTLTVTEIGGGAYKAPYTMGADGVPIGVLSTTGTADVKSVPASFVHLGTLDTIVTAVGDVHATDLPAIASMLTDIHGTDLPAVKADTAAIHTAIDDGTNGLSAIKAAIPAAAPTADANATALLDNALSGHTTAGTVGKKLTDLANADLSGVATASALATVDTVVDAILADTGTDGVVVAAASKTGYALTTAPPTAAANASAVRTELGTELGRVDAAISTRLATAGYTVPPTTAQIEAALLNEGDSSALLQAIADKVSGDWSAGDVSATAVASAVRTNLATELGRIDENVSSAKALTSAYDAAKTAASATALAAIDTLIDTVDTVVDGIATDVAAVHVHVGTIEGFGAPPSIASLATATAVSDLHTDVGTVITAIGGVNTDTDEILTRIPDATAGATGGLAIVGSAMGAVASVTAAVSCTDATAAKDDLANATDGLGALKAILDTAGVKVATLPDVQLAATQDHITPISSLTGIATATNVSDAQTAIIATLPDEAPAMITADAIADEVQTRTIARVTLVDTTTTNTDMVSVSGLSTFAPATDVVAHVTLVDTTTTNTDMVSEPPTMVDLSDLPTNAELGLAIAALATVQAAPDISGLSTFDPALDTVAHVTLVDTTTTNTDMVATAPSIADLPTNLELASAIADLAHVDAAPDISGLSTFNPTIETVTLGVAYDHAKDDVLTGIAGLSAVQSAPDISGLATSLQVAALNHVDAAPDLSGLATKTEVLALSPVTAAADPADVAALILVTPANKLVTNVDGSVNADATVDTAAIASDVVDALAVAGIPTLGVIEASTVLAMKADVAAIQAPTFSGTVTFDGTVEADMTPVTEAIAAIPAPTFDGTVTFSGTVSAPSVTVNPTVLSTGERAAIAAATDGLITTNHGTGTYGSATLAEGVTITPATLDTSGEVLGRVMPYGVVTVYHGEDAEYQFTADADGDYSYDLPAGSVWTLIARKSGYLDTLAITDGLATGTFNPTPDELVIITPATLDTMGEALGPVMPYGVVTVSLNTVAKYRFTADVDGDYTYALPVGHVWTLLARHAGYEDTSAEVSTEGVS